MLRWTWQVLLPIFGVHLSYFPRTFFSLTQQMKPKNIFYTASFTVVFCSFYVSLMNLQQLLTVVGNSLKWFLLVAISFSLTEDKTLTCIVFVLTSLNKYVYYLLMAKTSQCYSSLEIVWHTNIHVSCIFKWLLTAPVYL